MVSTLYTFSRTSAAYSRLSTNVVLSTCPLLSRLTISLNLQEYTQMCLFQMDRTAVLWMWNVATPLNQRSASNVTRSAIKSLIIKLLPSSHLTKHNGLVGLDIFISVVLWFTTRTATSYVYETRLKADRHIWVHRLRMWILLILIILVEFANFYDFLKC